MFVGTGEPVIPEVVQGPWDWVGAVLVIGVLFVIAVAYLIHAGPHTTR